MSDIDYFTAKTDNPTDCGTPLTAFGEEVAALIRDNPVLYAPHEDENGFPHLDIEDAEHCALEIEKIVSDRLTARDTALIRSAQVEVLRRAARMLAGYDEPVRIVETLADHIAFGEG